MAGHLPVHQCWACTIGYEHAGHYERYGTTTQVRRRSRWQVYESVVEYIESLPRGAVIERPVIAQALGRGPVVYAMTQLAVADMVLHGLLVCIRRGSASARNPRGSCFAFVIPSDVPLAATAAPALPSPRKGVRTMQPEQPSQPPTDAILAAASDMDGANAAFAADDSPIIANGVVNIGGVLYRLDIKGTAEVVAGPDRAANLEAAGLPPDTD